MKPPQGWANPPWIAMQPHLSNWPPGARVAPQVWWVFATVGLAACPTISIAALPPGVLTRPWNEVQTEHFAILTDGPPGPAFGVGMRLEQLMGALAQANPKLRAEPTQHTEIYVLQDAATLAAFQPPGTEHTAGFTLPTRGRNVFVVDGGAESDERRQVMCHEFTHLYIANNFADMPIFLNEGLAEYYSTFRLRGQVAEFGHKHEYWRRLLVDGGLQDIELLFAARPEGAVYGRDNPLRFQIYAEGWALVHYLQADPARAARFNGFLEAAHAGTPARIAFSRAFPAEEWPALVTRLKQYLQDDFIDPRSVPLSARLVSPETRTRDVPDAEALAALGDLDMDEGPHRYADSEEFYHAALARDSLQARAWCGLGMLAAIAGDTSRAESCFHRALTAAPDDERTVLFAGLGTMLCLSSSGPSVGASRRDELAALARARFTRVMQLDEYNPEALAGFGETFLVEGRMPMVGYRALAVASDALPARADVRAMWEKAVELHRAMKADSAGAAPTHH